MKYWLTTHWPRRVDEDPRTPGGVWVVDGKEQVIREIAEGDLVWIYEAAEGPETIRRFPDRRIEEIARRRGRQGAIALCRVTSLAYAREGSSPEEYKNHPKMWWRWHAPTEVLNGSGFVSRIDLTRILGYKPGYVFRGFGASRSGLKQIQETEHEALLEAFRSSVNLNRRDREAETFNGHGSGGEGPVHKALKESIAADPSAVLGEPGLALVRTEYPFPTGDRIDVLLLDSFGRYVAVEIEPACSEDELCGPLQCMKYRSMLAYVMGVPVAEIRTILASPAIHHAVDERCRIHGVETRLIELRPSTGA